jgi:DNA invertase Pin-like site-specific DNA recombinase
LFAVRPHETTTHRLAISYIRYSSPKQTSGDSIRRQTAATESFCLRNNLTLTDKYRLKDAGVSAFRGANLEPTAALGQFLKQVEAGQIPVGTTLICESLDRLSREKVRKALTLFLNLIDHGIEIVCLADNERKYTAKSVDDNSIDLITSILS